MKNRYSRGNVIGTYVKMLADIRKEMFEECGGKASHLGELTSMGVNVPHGFCVVAKAFADHLVLNKLD